MKVSIYLLSACACLFAGLVVGSGSKTLNNGHQQSTMLVSGMDATRQEGNAVTITPEATFLRRRVLNEEDETLVPPDANLANICLGSFGQQQFSFLAFDRYDNFFRDDSKMILAQAGVCQGRDNIEEYVKFATPFSPFFLIPNEEPEDASTPPEIRAVNENSCEFTIVLRSDYHLNPDTTAYASRVTIATMARFTYNFVENYVPSIYIYYDDGWLNFFFGKMLNSKETRKFICGDVLNGSCNYNIDHCEQELKKLDTFTGNDGSYVDGNSEGCRALHATFALANPTNHCPHVSLTPMLDPNGKMKCYQSNQIQINELFDDADFTQYNDFQTDVLGIDPEIGYLETCDKTCANKMNAKKEKKTKKCNKNKAENDPF